MEYDQEDVWVTRIIQHVSTRSGLNPMLSNLFTLGAIPLILTVLYFNFATNTPSLIYRINQTLLAVAVSSIGYIIWYYDKIVMPDFFSRVRNIVDADNEFDSLVSKYNNYFAHQYWKTFIFWLPLFPIAFFGNRTFFVEQGLGTVTDISFWALFIFTIYTGIITGMGIHLIINTLLCVGSVSKMDLSIDPLDPDGLGGMSAIGSLSIRTMGLASLGSLGMPFTLQIASNGQFKYAIYTAYVIYFATLVGIFVYPVVISTRKAESDREKKLESLRDQIRTTDTKIEELESNNSDSPERMQTLELRHQRLRNKYDKYNNVKLYPMSIGIITRFAGSILLPLFFIILEFYLSMIL